MIRKFYLVWGCGVLLLLVWATWRGWSCDDATRVREVPRSVRDNPGTYRSHYSSFYTHYMGGK